MTNDLSFPEMCKQIYEYFDSIELRTIDTSLKAIKVSRKAVWHTFGDNTSTDAAWLHLESNGFSLTDKDPIYGPDVTYTFPKGVAPKLIAEKILVVLQHLKIESVKTTLECLIKDHTHCSNRMVESPWFK